MLFSPSHSDDQIHDVQGLCCRASSMQQPTKIAWHNFNDFITKWHMPSHTMLFPGLCRICLLALTHLLAHTFESCCYCHIQPSNICFVCLKVVGESEETPAQFNSDHDLLSSFFPHSNADISRPSWEIVGATWSLPLPPAASLCNPAWGLVLALPTSPTNSTTTTVNFLLGCSNHRVTTCSVH